MLNTGIYRKARLSRDARFDGKFFTAVKSTGIFCRPICPAKPPQENNVQYFASAIEAANAGFRPCLRCRPDSAPGSPAWRGVNTTLERAIKLIEQGSLSLDSVPSLAERLGVSDRYLRQLFSRFLGIPPSRYARFQQCLFAKNLLHQTSLPITQVAFASGFGSIRRFNACFKKLMKLTPSEVRKEHKAQSGLLEIQLSYRPPLNWEFMHSFFRTRAIQDMEWCDNDCYGRTFQWQDYCGQFTVQHIRNKNAFSVSIELENLKPLWPVLRHIRQILDLDADMEHVENHLKASFGNTRLPAQGIRLPGAWNMFEAGIRAILGQQISVKAANKLCCQLVSHLGTTLGNKKLFPTARQVSHSDLGFLRIPHSRRQTIHNLARHYLSNKNPDDPLEWLKLKGIGTWTVDYAKLRGLADTDVFLASDLGIKQTCESLPLNIDPTAASPWRSYLNVMLWSLR